MDPWLLAALIFFAYGAVIIILSQTGLLARANVQAFGPFLVWRTGRFREVLERLSKRPRVWGAFARVSVGLVFLVMLTMVVTLVVQSLLVTRIPPDTVNPQYAIGIPGVNPIIPLGYGILGLAVAILVHEGCHGVLARVEGIKVRSVGLLLVLFPIGAFVEPDEQEMRAAPIPKRQRVYAVGPSSNIVLALVCAAVFSTGFIGSLEPVDDGVVALIVPGGPADLAGIANFTLIDAINNSSGRVVDLTNEDDFRSFMGGAVPGEVVTLHLYYKGEYFTRDVTLAPRTPPVANLSAAVVGVYPESTSILTRTALPGAAFSERCAANDRGFGSGCYAAVSAAYLGMPVSGLSPAPPELESLYRPAGAMAGLGGAFWPLANTFYWLFWLNFMVGTFNALPMLPLDGGHMYKDAVLSLLKRRALRRAPSPDTAGARDAAPPGPAKKAHPADEIFGPPRRSLDPLDRRAQTITAYTSVAMLVLILLPFFIPRLVESVGG